MAEVSKSRYLLLAAAVLALDQATKAFVTWMLDLHASRPIIPGFFNIVHTRNPGAVFGFFQNSASSLLPKILTLLSLAALAFVVIYFRRCPVGDRLNLTGLGLILGGAVGNIADRIVRLSVVDFLEFYIRDYRWPAFNVADSAICIGIVLLLLGSLRDRSEPARMPDSGASQGVH